MPSLEHFQFHPTCPQCWTPCSGTFLSLHEYQAGESTTHRHTWNTSRVSFLCRPNTKLSLLVSALSVMHSELCVHCGRLIGNCSSKSRGDLANVKPIQRKQFSRADVVFTNRLNITAYEVSSYTSSPVLGTVPAKTCPQLVPLKILRNNCTLHIPADIWGIVPSFSAPRFYTTKELHVLRGYES